MHYVEDRYHLKVEFHGKDCTIPQDELTRMQQSLGPVGEAVQDLPGSELWITVHQHPRQDYHVEAKLRMPGRTVFSGDSAADLDSAFQRCVRKLARKAEDYARNPRRDAVEATEKITALDSA